MPSTDHLKSFFSIDVGGGGVGGVGDMHSKIDTDRVLITLL